MAKAPTVSLFAPEALARLPAIDGVAFATAEAGIRYKKRTDLLLAVLDAGTAVAGVLTQSKTASAPVLACRKHLKKGEARALVVNSGNANAFTGKKGSAAVEITVAHAVEAVGCKPHEVFVASTGVIGEPLDAEKFAHLLGDLAKHVKPDTFEKAARAILTTDTYPKLATRTALIGDTEVTINGFCKGAGMIAPDMATMLCFMFTDAAISADALQDLVAEHAQTTFNCMTVDGDTSTSDTCLIFATGRAAARGQKPVIKAGSKKLERFSEALFEVMRDLAIRSPRTEKGSPSSSPSRSRVPNRGKRRAKSLSPAPTRRSSRRRSRAKIRTGAASSWRSANLVKPPIATSSPSGLVPIALRATANGPKNTMRRRSRPI
jgi:glutamate N-acetyltransferase/amino-acid N-acetyltransferase